MLSSHFFGQQYLGSALIWGALVTIISISNAQIVSLDRNLCDKASLLTQDQYVSKAARECDTKALYTIAKAHLDEATKSSKVLAVNTTAFEILHALADHTTNPHIASQVALGFAYYGSGDRVKSLEYFVLAGETGPHQSSLYNAGRIYAESSNWIPALGYMQAAINFQNTHPQKTEEKLTKTCIKAYDILCENIAFHEEAQKLTLEETADLFLYASPTDYPNYNLEAKDLWRNAVLSLQKFNRTLSQTRSVNLEFLDEAAGQLRKLWETGSSNMSKLQAHLVLKNVNRVLGLLASTDNIYLEAAAGYAEALALSPFCSQMAASSIEHVYKCFNKAVSDGMAYYRRLNDSNGATRVFKYARLHPNSATSWKSFEQTPEMYYEGQVDKPWHEPEDFLSLRKVLQSAGKTILAELQHVKVLPDDQPYVSAFQFRQNAQSNTQTVEISGTGDAIINNINVGFRPILSAHIRSKSFDFGRAEFVLLPSVGSWNQESCRKLPQLCEAIRLVESNIKIVKIVRLRPGTAIVPHCGNSNKELMIYDCLEGCAGVDITVAGATVNDFRPINEDSDSVVVFDSSFEHSIVHNGPSDCYFLSRAYAV